MGASYGSVVLQLEVNGTRSVIISRIETNWDFVEEM